MSHRTKTDARTRRQLYTIHRARRPQNNRTSQSSSFRQTSSLCCAHQTHTHTQPKPQTCVSACARCIIVRAILISSSTRAIEYYKHAPTHLYLYNDNDDSMAQWIYQTNFDKSLVCQCSCLRLHASISYAPMCFRRNRRDARFECAFIYTIPKHEPQFFASVSVARGLFVYSVHVRSIDVIVPGRKCCVCV